MAEPESVLKTITGEKTFHFGNGNIDRYTGKSAVSSKVLDEETRELDERFEMKFHLQRSDFERWINSILKDEDVAKQIKESRETVLPPQSFRERSAQRTL